jgi:hypothetical protein
VRPREFAKPWTAIAFNAGVDCVETSLILTVVAVPANTNGFSHLYTNPPVTSPLWSLPAVPTLTTGRPSIGHKTALSRKLAGFNFWPVHARFEMREDWYIVATYKSTRWRKVFLNNRWQRGMTELHTRSYLLVLRLRNWDIWVILCMGLNVSRKTWYGESNGGCKRNRSDSRRMQQQQQQNE